MPYLQQSPGKPIYRNLPERKGWQKGMHIRLSWQGDGSPKALTDEIQKMVRQPMTYTCFQRTKKVPANSWLTYIDDIAAKSKYR